MVEMVLSGSRSERGQLLVAWCSLSLESPVIARFSLAVRLKIGAAAGAKAVLLIKVQSDSVIGERFNGVCSASSDMVRRGCELLDIEAAAGGSSCRGLGCVFAVLLFGGRGDVMGEVRLREYSLRECWRNPSSMVIRW